jgi:hypothetical protein
MLCIAAVILSCSAGPALQDGWVDIDMFDSNGKLKGVDKRHYPFLFFMWDAW